MKQMHHSDKKFGKDLSIKEGQTFIPFNTFIGGFLPDPIMETNILTGTEKVCWAKLSQFAGRDGFCYPSLSVLAKSIGVSVRQVNRVVKGLVDKKFIRREAPSRLEMIQGRTTTRYYFLWHVCFNDAQLKSEAHASASSDTYDTDVMKDTTNDIHGPSPDGADVIPPGDIHAVSPNGIDVTQRESYLKDYLEENKKKGGKNFADDKTGYPSQPNASSFDSFENEKNALLERYTPEQQALIRECIACLKTTRRSGKIADSLLLAELGRWDKVDVERVMHGIRIYMNKEYYLKNKNGKYLWGIIRNIRFKDIQGKPRGGPCQRRMDLPFYNQDAYNTCREWIEENTGGNHAGIYSDAIIENREDHGLPN